ncbi:hypothetical protein [Limnohabitans sp. Rim8]|uniref:hypothetical protein n=1 Tax=Limnohabitans sp. Rim8 TaxID=1100718 RepID=UPI00261847AA|nr:hypothetical protein [Limnohabitans sp. Rim8]
MQRQPLLKEGFADAIGFLGGSVAGFWIGRWLGLDIFAAGYGPGTLVAILLVSLGGGIGLQAAKAWWGTKQKNKL